jgi:serine/threonine-protein kinase Chk1
LPRSRVKLGEHLINAKKIAVKILSLKKVHRDDVRKEICVHKMLKHPNIVSFLDHEARQDTIFLLLELSSCGELFDKIGKAALIESNVLDVLTVTLL